MAANPKNTPQRSAIDARQRDEPTRVLESFAASLVEFDLGTLERDAHPIFGLDADLRLAYMNPSWFRFAVENGGEPAISRQFGLGAFAGDWIQGPLSAMYLDAYRRTIRTGVVWHQEYECSSPQTYRRYHQAAYPLRGGRGLVAVNSLVVSRPMTGERPAHQPERTLYTTASGLITQCCNCRRVQRADRSDTWDWVPAWVENMPEGVSHGLCYPCFEYYYKFRAAG